MGVLTNATFNPANLATDTNLQRVALIVGLAGTDALAIEAFFAYMSPSSARLATTFLLLPQQQLAELVSVFITAAEDGSFTDTSKR